AMTTNAQQRDFPKLSGPYLGQKPPGTTPEIFAPGIISTDMYNHCSVCVSPDGTEIYWAMAPLDTPRRIYFVKMENGIWKLPQIIAFTQTEDGDCPMLSTDGKKMFFNSNRPISQGGNRRERIWCVERTSNGWGAPFCLSAEINNEHLHWQVSVDSNENLYFGSERDGTKGKDDVFIAEFLNGKYSKAYSLGTEINSEAHESTPYIAPDGSYLIFSRNGLHISYKQKNGYWTKAKSLGDNFEKAFCPYVSPDGKYIFFLKMGMGFNDIYWVSTEIIEELKPGNLDKLNE
ncbi:MAG: PD40 domain-containing protein, partial [Bacteroidales bacterium]|nr:PD40 domain-containing protein [Bacteroidales bacterium]